MFLLTFLFAITSHARSTPVELLGSHNTPFRTCLLSELKTSLRASKIRLKHADVVVRFPHYAEVSFDADFSDGERARFTLLLHSADTWSQTADGISAPSVERDPVVRDSSLKDVVVLNLANCQL